MGIKFKTAAAIGLTAVLAGAMFQTQAAEKSPEKTIGVLKGKCGEGKCGTVRVRQMMDDNADGMIDRQEYVAWSTSQAVAEFDKISGGAGSTSADAVFQNFLAWEAISEEH